MFNVLDVLDRHAGSIPAAMVAALTDETLDRYLWHLSFDLLKRRDGREFGRWLLGVTTGEMKRRQSDGALEICSYEIPILPIGELPAALRLSNLITYGQFPEAMARLFDYLHWDFLHQAANRLSDK